MTENVSKNFNFKNFSAIKIKTAAKLKTTPQSIHCEREPTLLKTPTEYLQKVQNTYRRQEDLSEDLSEKQLQNACIAGT